MENEALVKEVLAKITRLCSRSEQCSPDIRKKIISEGIEEDVADEMMQSLKEENYLDDERYVKSYVADKFKFNKWGRVKMRYYLRLKGLPDEIILIGLNVIDHEKYKAILIKTMKDKAKTVKKKNKFEKMGQVIRFAQNRGFEPELIHRYMKLAIE
jgi:regulatory protein